MNNRTDKRKIELTDLLLYAKASLKKKKKKKKKSGITSD
jgi:hypothetical protein